MKDSQGNLVLGRTSWRRFAAVAGVATVAVVGLMAGVAQGFVPVSINISGQTARLSADKLEADGFSQFGGVVLKKGANPETGEGVIPVAASEIKSAKITNLCQSVKVPNPLGGEITMFIRGGREAGKPVEAESLVIAMDYLAGDAVFTNIDIGKDASTLTKGRADGLPTPIGQAGQFGQEADTAVITGLQQQFYSTSATTFRLTGMTLHLKFDGSECFSTLKP